MKKLVLLTSLALLILVSQASAAANSTFTIRGAGFGHGIGMSQYGAYGYAAHGADWKNIVLHYFTDTHLGNAAGRTIRVLLQSGNKTVWVSGATRAGNHKLDSTKSYRLVRTGLNGVELRAAAGKRIATMDGVVPVSSSSGSVVLGGRAISGLSGGRYRGVLEVRPGTFGGLMAVNALPLDSYIQGVIVGEMPTSWPQPALEAQAVVARSYALTSDAGGAIFDQYPDTRSQMYYGMSRETAGTNLAVQSTAGQVVMYGDQVATTYYFSTSGGRTENIENSWPGTAPVPYLRSVDDPYDNLSPRHRWRFVWSRSRLDAKLGGFVKGKLKAVQVTKRGVSPRIVSAKVVGSKGTTAVSGPQLRSRLRLYDTWAYFISIKSGQQKTPLAPPAQPMRNDQVTNGGGVTASAASWLRRVFGVRKLVVEGSVAPAAKKIALQKLGRRGWKTIGYGKTDTRGRYALLVRSTGAYRVLAHGGVGPTVHVR
ncbi:MAG TPA: SpoIID/LytB domain-containing protein [Thermoleophilaceae bacterium]|nr:SpoIID/LytB domain-containing protein [Thermoleophilaceae bacterium]